MASELDDESVRLALAVDLELFAVERAGVSSQAARIAGPAVGLPGWSREPVSMSEEAIVQTTDPEDAFTALADERRVAILKALWDPTIDWSTEGATTFSDLREAVGMRDSGQFNYHLDKLSGLFVRKTEDGYRLTLAGRQVLGAIRAGSFTTAGSVDPFVLDDPCPVCGEGLTFRYEDEQVHIACGDCNMALQFWIPPGVFEGVDRRDFPEVASRYMRASVQKMKAGFCWFCQGPMATELVPVGDLVPETTGEVALADDLPLVRIRCTRCGESVTNDLGTALLDESVVVAFHETHGVDVPGTHWWHNTIVDVDRAHFTDDGTPRACVHFEAGGEELRVVVDGALSIVETDRIALD